MTDRRDYPHLTIVGPDEPADLPACVRRDPPTRIETIPDSLLADTMAGRETLVTRVARAMGPVLAAMFGVDEERAGLMYAVSEQPGERARLMVDAVLTEEHVAALERFAARVRGPLPPSPTMTVPEAITDEKGDGMPLGTRRG